MSNPKGVNQYTKRGGRVMLPGHEKARAASDKRKAAEVKEDAARYAKMPAYQRKKGDTAHDTVLIKRKVAKGHC